MSESEIDHIWEARAENAMGRRTADSQQATNATARMIRKETGSWTPGVGKILSVFGKSITAEEKRQFGIEQEIFSDPDLTIIDNVSGRVIRIRSDHAAEAVHDSKAAGERVFNRTKGHGYRRFPMKVQRNSALMNPSALFAVMFEKLHKILKPSKAQTGYLIEAVMKETKELNKQLATMEKSTGSKYLKELLERSGVDVLIAQMKDSAVEGDIVQNKVGDSHINILVEELENPAFSDIMEFAVFADIMDGEE